MNEILKKLQLKNIEDQKLIINAPSDYQKMLANDGIHFDTNVSNEKYPFIQIFGLSNDEIHHFAVMYLKKLEDDGLLWLCYPKKTSKKYKSTDCHRDSVATLLAEFNYEPVRQVAIDEDFSALRFRHVSNIKTMIRKSAESEEGKKRIENK